MDFPENVSSLILPSTFKSQPRATQITVVRWMKFNFVGGLGIAVQLCTLAILKTGMHLDYSLATALAVETTLAHNFLWHVRFTWPDRRCLSWKETLFRFVKFNLTTGAFSILGNLGLMKLLVDAAHIPYLLANLLSIACCSIVNFLLSDWLVFSRAGGKKKMQRRKKQWTPALNIAKDT
jgi:putative flippase GtrA